MTSFDFGDVVLVPFPFQSHPSTFEVYIQHWQHARLLKPSIFKPLVTTVERHLILKKLGELHADDRDRLSELLRNMLGV